MDVHRFSEPLSSIPYVADPLGRVSPAAYLTTRARSTVTSASPVIISSRIGSNCSTCGSSSTTSISTGRSADVPRGWPCESHCLPQIPRRRESRWGTSKAFAVQAL
jgi:hypothetical protein